VGVCCSMLKCIAVYCSVLQYVAADEDADSWVGVCCSMLKCIAVYCSVL